MMGPGRLDQGLLEVCMAPGRLAWRTLCETTGTWGTNFRWLFFQRNTARTHMHTGLHWAQHSTVQPAPGILARN